MTKVMVVSSLGHGNIGDDAILFANIDVLRENHIDDIEILTPVPFQASRITDVKCRSDLWSLFHSSRMRKIQWSWNLVQIAFAFFSFLMLWNARRLARGKRAIALKPEENELLSAIAESDALLVCGGGAFNDHFNYRGIALALIIAKMLGIKCFIGANSIGPITSNFARYFLRYAFERTFLTVRDTNLSKRYIIDSIGLRTTDIIECVDDAFALVPFDYPKMKQIFQCEGIEGIETKGKRKHIGINCRAWWKETGKEKDLSFFVEIVKHLIKDDNEVIFFPMSSGQDPTFKDVENAVEIVRALGEEKNPNIKILKGIYDPREIKAMLQILDFSIGISYHFNLFSLSQNVPTIGLYQDAYYEIKLKGLYRIYDNEENAIDITEHSVDYVKERIEYTIANGSDTLRKINQTLSFKSCVAAKELARIFAGETVS